MLQSIFDFFKPLIDFIAWIIEFLGSLVVNLGKFIWSLFEGAINLIVSGISTIVDWVGSFFKFLGDLLHDLFVPDDDYFSKNFDKLNKEIEGKMNIDDYKNAINALTRPSRSGFTDLKANLYGKEVTIIPFSYVNQYLDDIQNWCRGFFFIFIVLYNVNFFYKLIRGGDSITPGLASTTHFGENQSTAQFKSFMDKYNVK